MVHGDRMRCCIEPAVLPASVPVYRLPPGQAAVVRDDTWMIPRASWVGREQPSNAGWPELSSSASHALDEEKRSNRLARIPSTSSDPASLQHSWIQQSERLTHRDAQRPRGPWTSMIAARARNEKLAHTREESDKRRRRRE